MNAADLIWPMASPSLWKQRAMAFVVRSHHHLFGKNNEDPMVYLYRKGLSIDLAKRLYLGWNKFGQDRKLAAWGLESGPEAEKFRLPPGIVVPYIKKKELTSIFILSMAEQTHEPFEPCVVPGSATRFLELGNPNPTPEIFNDLIEGLARFEDSKMASFIRIELP